MSLLDLLNRRRSVRHYDENQPIDAEVVKECLQAAQLAPTSSNMQLYELYHVTDPATLNKLAAACMHQQAAKTAQQMVVFVTRQDLYRRRAKAALEFERGNVERNSPAEKQKDRIKNWEMYYTKAMPLLYARCFGLLGASRAAMANCAGLFVPMMREVSEHDYRVVVHQSCGLVAQTFMLAMTEAGYDTCPMEGFDSHRVKKLLNLPRNVEINMVVACGIRKPGHGIWGERFRLPFDEVYRRV